MPSARTQNANSRLPNRGLQFVCISLTCNGPVRHGFHARHCYLCNNGRLLISGSKVRVLVRPPFIPDRTLNFRSPVKGSTKSPWGSSSGTTADIPPWYLHQFTARVCSMTGYGIFRLRYLTCSIQLRDKPSVLFCRIRSFQGLLRRLCVRNRARGFGRRGRRSSACHARSKSSSC